MKIRTTPGRSCRLCATTLLLSLVASLGCACFAPTGAEAYVGPGAGFALAGSLWTFIILILAALSILILPFRFLLVWLRNRKTFGKSRADRVVVIGLDGLDPGLAARWMDAGHLPSFKKLAEQGVFSPLRTTLPAITPAAWSAFLTGVDASRHNIYDFITRDPRTYRPVLSSAAVLPPSRTLSLGRHQIPLRRPRVSNLRKSQPFWKVLGDRHIFSSIVRVPITFPPEKFNGVLLAGMCVPDLRGTQGEGTCFTSEASIKREADQARTIQVELDQGKGQTRMPGPPNPLCIDGKVLELVVNLEVDLEGESVELLLGKRKIKLQKQVYSPWMELVFNAGWGIKIRGICRFYLVETEPLKLYATPIQIDPLHPSLPLSHPASYAHYLSRRLDRFGSLGLAEDTDALNTGIIDEQAFLDQAYLLHAEREAMLFHALEKTKKGLTVCVFDASDRIQHMFFRTLDPTHPANEDKEVEAFENTILDMYRRMDDLVGRTMQEVDDPRTILMVISDHGFCPFRRGVNLNTWLHQNGYLCLQEGKTQSREWLVDVDWGRTRAFALGLTGLFVNRRGREARGIVDPGAELNALKTELIQKLSGLMDEETGEVAINKAWDTEAHFSGPYTGDAPDLLIGYNAGYRASWGGASGKVIDAVFEDNTRPWSGDHCVDPQLVPGAFFCNRKIQSRDPGLLDLPFSILRLFGVDPPSYMQGKDLFAAPDEPEND